MKRPATKVTRRNKMGRGNCAVCLHAQQAEIDAGLIRGDSGRALGRQYGISEFAIRNHKHKHLSPALVAIVARAANPETVGLVDKLRGLVSDAEAVLKAAIAGGNGSMALAAIREVRTTLELVGKATGELKERPAVSVNLQSSPEWASMRSRIVEAIPPNLRPEIAKRLEQLDG